MNEDEKGTVKASATLFCKAGAADIKKAGDKRLAGLQTVTAAALKDPNLTRWEKEGHTAMSVVFDAVKISVAGDKVIGSIDIAPVTLATLFLTFGTPTLDLETTREIQTEMLAMPGEKATWAIKAIRGGQFEKIVPVENKHVTATFDANTYILTLTVGAGAKAGDRAMFSIHSGGATTKLIVTLR